MDLNLYQDSKMILRLIYLMHISVFEVTGKLLVCGSDGTLLSLIVPFYMFSFHRRKTLHYNRKPQLVN